MDNTVFQFRVKYKKGYINEINGINQGTKLQVQHG